MICIIDNYDSFTMNITDLVLQFGYGAKTIKNDELSLEQIHALEPEAFIFSPGPGRPDETGICGDVLEYYIGRRPILGVCLGHQLIAEFFGGKVVEAAAVRHGVVENIYHFGNDRLYSGMLSPFQATLYNSLIVEKESFPKDLVVTSQLESGEIMGLSHRSRLLFGVQFHPESIATREGYKLIRNFLDTTMS